VIQDATPSDMNKQIGGLVPLTYAEGNEVLTSFPIQLQIHIVRLLRGHAMATATGRHWELAKAFADIAEARV
jgi:hypothetical protein